jgi:histidinol-phosphate aminotransferase
MSESLPAAWRFAILARTAFCRSFSGLLNIDSALTLISLARRDDADDFFAIDVLAADVHDQQESRRDGPNRMPSPFALNHAVFDQNDARIVEHASRGFEVQPAVLLLVNPTFLCIPFEANVSYEMYNNFVRESKNSQGWHSNPVLGVAVRIMAPASRRRRQVVRLPIDECRFTIEDRSLAVVIATHEGFAIDNRKSTIGNSLAPRRAIQNLGSSGAPSEGRAGKLRLDMNENTAGPSLAVVRAVQRAARDGQLGTYPEYQAARTDLARHFGVPAGQLLLTNGIDDGLKLICDTFVDPGDVLLLPDPTFTMYRFFHSVAGGKTVLLPYDRNFRLPWGRLLDALRPKRGRRPRWLVLANPNNPTGTLIPQAELKVILGSAPDTLVLVDEAYFDYSGKTVLPWINQYPNLVVTRTFSKAHGLAALRLGVIFACQELADCLRRAQPVFPVNSLALAGALESIRHPEAVHKHVQQVLRNRALLCGFLDSLGVPYAPSASNFVFASFGERAPEIARRLEKRGILVRHWLHDPRLRRCFRIGIGTMAEMRKLIDVLQSLRKMIEPQDPEKVWGQVFEGGS